MIQLSLQRKLINYSMSLRVSRRSIRDSGGQSLCCVKVKNILCGIKNVHRSFKNSHTHYLFDKLRDVLNEIYGFTKPILLNSLKAVCRCCLENNDPYNVLLLFNI